ncbi:MAG: zinc metalloprotease HtpX [Blastocatellia bacterium]
MMTGINRMKTLILLGSLTALVLILGRAIGGQAGLMIAIVMAGGMNFVSYWWSDKIVLRTYNAQEVDEATAPELFNIVRELANRGQIPMPKVYIIPEETPNAFATGRNPQNAAVACTVGLMQMLDRRELAGVIGHELGHVMNRDTLIMTVAASLAGALGYLAQFAMFFGGGSSDDDDRPNILAVIVGMLVAMFAAPMIQMAISRSREFIADEAGANLTRDPQALASALRKIESYSQQIPIHSGSPETAHLFIINPFSGGGVAKLFSTHPATAERVARLEAMARRAA